MNQLRISQVDALFTGDRYPIEFLFFYPRTIDTAVIRSAMAGLVEPFWPVFGDFRQGWIRFKDYREDECLHEVSFSRDFQPPRETHRLIDWFGGLELPPGSHLFHLTVLQFTNGTVLVPRLNHLAGDGYSYFFLLSALAALARQPGRDLDSLDYGFTRPFHKRTCIRSFNPRNLMVPRFEAGENFRIQNQQFAREKIRAILRTLRDQAGQAVSVNDYLSAVVLKTLAAETGKDHLELTMPVDVRRYVKAYGPGFFGNALYFHRSGFAISSLKTMDPGELAVRIRRSIPGDIESSYRAFLSEIEARIAAGKAEELRPYHPQRGCLVTNLSLLPTHRLDFGTGKPELVYPLTIGSNSAVILADSRRFILRLAYPIVPGSFNDPVEKDPA